MFTDILKSEKTKAMLKQNQRVKVYESPDAFKLLTNNHVNQTNNNLTHSNQKLTTLSNEHENTSSPSRQYQVPSELSSKKKLKENRIIENKDTKLIKPFNIIQEQSRSLLKSPKPQ